MLHRKVSTAWLLTAMGDVTHYPGLQDLLLGRVRRHVFFPGGASGNERLVVGPGRR